MSKRNGKSKSAPIHIEERAVKVLTSTCETVTCINIECVKADPSGNIVGPHGMQKVMLVNTAGTTQKVAMEMSLDGMVAAQGDNGEFELMPSTDKSTIPTVFHTVKANQIMVCKTPVLPVHIYVGDKRKMRIDEEMESVNSLMQNPQQIMKMAMGMLEGKSIGNMLGDGVSDELKEAVNQTQQGFGSNPLFSEMSSMLTGGASSLSIEDKKNMESMVGSIMSQMSGMGLGGVVPKEDVDVD